MADLIKKIKIKKQDGTFTDYIPIGAEAQNVSTSDGDSVQLKLNKKPYYYNTIADMKADTKLKDGDMAITFGYYEVNDGGGAEYKIIGTVSQTEYQEGLGNGLYATLIIENDILNVKQIGAKGDGITDDTVAFQNMFAVDSYNYYIPKGNYLVEHNLVIMTNIQHNIKIYGEGIALTKLKLKDNSITENNQPMFLLQSDENNNNSIEIEIENLYIDMNRTNNNLGIPDTSFDLQHCHAIVLDSMSVNGINAKVHDLEFYDCIADGICFRGGTNKTFDSIMVDRIIAKGRQGTRDDVCITADFNNAIVSNCDLDAFEVEVNVYKTTSKHNLLVENIVTRKRFDLDGDCQITDSTKSPTNYIVNNCIMNGIIVFTSVYAKITNSILNFGNSVLRPNASEIEFINCDINDDYKTLDENGMISINNTQTTRLLFKNNKISCNNSEYFIYHNLINPYPTTYYTLFEGNYITGAPNGSYCRICSSDFYAYNNIIDMTANKHFIYLGTINNSFTIDMKHNILNGDGYLFTNSSSSVSSDAPSGTVVTIKSKYNTSKTFGHLINWTNLDKITSRRGGTGDLYDVVEIDDYEYNTSPNIGKWLKGQRVYNTNPSTSYMWICTSSGSFTGGTAPTFSAISI